MQYRIQKNLKNFIIFFVENVRYVIGLIIFLCTLSSLTYKFLLLSEKQYYKTLLENYQNSIKVLIIENLDYSFNNLHEYGEMGKAQYISIIKDYIKNYHFTPKTTVYNNHQHNYLASINLFDLINNLSSMSFHYAIFIDDKLIVSNGLLGSKNALVGKYKLSTEMWCTIAVELDDNSIYINSSNLRVLYNTCIISLIITALSTAIIILIATAKRQKQYLQSEIRRLNNNLNIITSKSSNIIHFNEKSKKFIIECYKYSQNFIDLNLETLNHKKEPTNYLPLPLITIENIDEALSTEIRIIPLITELQEYIVGYNAYYNTKVTFEVFNKIAKITVPFEKELFNQIIVSLVFNILYFIKDQENIKYIKFKIEENKVTLSSNGFFLDQDLAIKYSKKIFYDTGNLYILSIEQVLALIKRYNSKAQILKNNNETKITIEISTPKTEALESSNFNSAKILNISKFKK